MVVELSFRGDGLSARPVGSVPVRYPGGIRLHVEVRVSLTRFANPLLAIGLLVVGFFDRASASTRQDDGSLVEYLEIARGEFERGRFDSCTKTLGELLEEAPGLVPAQVLLLRAESARGNYQAADDLDRALAALPQFDREAALARAEYSMSRGRLETVEALASRLLDADERDIEAAVLQARTLAERGARGPLKELIDTTLGRETPERDDIARQFAMAKLLAVAGQLERASEFGVFAEKAMRDAGAATADVLLLLGDLERQALVLDGKEEPRAFQTYRAVLAQNPGSVAAHVGLAWMHLYVNASFAAEKEIDDALAIHPEHPDALVVRAWIHVTDARHTDALKALERALAVNPNHKKARAVRAAALHLLRRNDEFTQEESAVLSLDPTYGEFYSVLGDAYSRVYRFEEAVPFHRKALELDPTLPLAPISLGRDLCFCGEEAEGKEALERSKETHPFAHPWRHNMLLVLGKLRDQFVDVVSDNFLLKLHVDENAVLGPLLRHAMEQDLVMLQEKYGWQIERDVLVEMFPRMADFSVRSVGLVGVGAVGVCFGHLVTLVSPRSEARWTFVWRRTALHELTHVITLGRSKKRVPRWFTEGLSVYEERCVKPSWYRDQIAELNDAVANDDLLRLRTFNAAFRGPRIGFGYYQAGLFCEFVAVRHGFDKILAMLDAYAEDLETPQVIEKVFGRDCETLDEEFEQWVRAEVLRDVRVQPNYGPEARRALRERVKREPQNADAIAELAWAYASAGKEVDADVQLDALRKVAPDHPAGLRLLANRQLARGNSEAARELLERAFAGGGLEYFSALRLAELRLAADDRAGCEAALRIAYDCFRDDPSPQSAAVRLAELLREDGRDEEARALDIKRIELIESAVEPRIDHAEFLLGVGDLAGALRFIDEAEDIDPFLRRVERTRAKILEQGGDSAGAVAALRRALLVDPRFEPSYSPPRSAEERTNFEAVERRQQAEILTEIAEIELTMGDLTAARRDHERAKELDPDSERVRALGERLK
jgi:tetratricopeptide (TPR) repeat protein